MGWDDLEFKKTRGVVLFGAVTIILIIIGISVVIGRL
jgi:hypothetical protein